MFRVLLIIAVAILFSPQLWARKDVQALYQDPFDIAGGGASLTRASQDAVVYANPALMPWGPGIYRYSGLMVLGRYSPDSVAAAQNLSTDDPVALVDEIEGTPLYGGVGVIASMVLKKFAFSLLASTLIDLEFRQYGSESGGPSLDLMAEGYGVASIAVADTAGKWFSYGFTLKHITKSEPEIIVPITSEERIEELTSGDEATAQLTPGQGLGVDFGMLFFAKGKNVDYRLALKMDDLGGVSFGGAQLPFEQMLHVGQGLTFHSHVHALHLALDYRDVTDAYGLPLYKKVYTGMKLMLQNHIGFALGLYHGLPSFGVRLDLWAIKLGITQYSEERDNVIGRKQRNISVVYLAMGW